MKKKILYAFTLLTLSSLNVIGQTKTCDEKVNLFLIEKIKSYQSIDLIPYFSEKENKWGYFHRKTKKILTTPVLNDATFFNPSIEFYYSFETDGEQNGCDGKISGSKDKFKIDRISTSGYQMYSMDEGQHLKKSYKSFVKEGISGFEVDSIGNLTSFSPKFYDSRNDKPRIFNFINFKGEYYALASMTENDTTFFTVINQKGASMPNFERITFYPSIKQIYTSDDDIWFFIRTGKDEYVFKSLLKGKRLKETFKYPSDWRYQTKTIGYNIFTVGKAQGILDLTTMKWKISPSIKNDFRSIEFTSLTSMDINPEKTEYFYTPATVIPTEMINTNRSKSYIYIQDSNKLFCDLELKYYKPIK